MSTNSIGPLNKPSKIKIASVVIIIIIIIVLVLYFQYSKSNFVVKRIGGNSYKVCENYSNFEQAAEILDKLNLDIVKLIAHLDVKYLQDSNFKNANLIRGIKQTKQMYRPTDSIQENIPSSPTDDTAYTINKGEIIAMCLRDLKNKNNFHDYNSLLFVKIHEIAHIFSITLGHDTAYWTHFKFLLKEAVNIGIYKSVDYSKYPINYCGVDVKYSPLYDNSLRV
jgi:hypothetical protein